MHKQWFAGRIWIVLMLAALPFVAKGAVVWWGLKGYAWQSLYKVVQIAIPVGWRRQVEGHRGTYAVWPWDAGWPGAGTWFIAVLAAIGLAGSAVVAVTQIAPAMGLVIDPTELRAQMDDKFAMTPARAALVVLYLFTLNAAIEELLFRWWLDREVSAAWGDCLGIGISGSVFAAMHLFIFADMSAVTPLMLGLVFAALFLAGLVWSLIARRQGGIQAAWLSHGLTDAGLLTWGLFWLGYF